MGGNLKGRRGAQEDDWHWLREETRGQRPNGRRGRIVFLVAAVASMALTAAISLGLFFALQPDDAELVALPPVSPTPTVSPTPAISPTPTGQPELTPTPTPGPTPTAEPTPPAAPQLTVTVSPPDNSARFRLAFWDGEAGEWRFDELWAEQTEYEEGDAIPFMLRIDDTSPGTVYDVRIHYGCPTGAPTAFDFLTGYSRDAGTAPALAQQGPGRSRHDASIPIPSDPTIVLDDGELQGDRLLRLWGATFEAAPIGPIANTSCYGQRIISFSIRAQADTVFILWGGHLAGSPF